MACPMGFTELDGENPHQQQPAITRSIPQKDGRIAPPLPPKPKNPPTPWHLTQVKQGPVPVWASTIAAWYNQLWGLGRALVLVFFLAAVAPFLHILSLLAVTLPLRIPLLRGICELLFTWPFRWVQMLYTGTIVCLMESMAGISLMFSGKVSESFWTGEPEEGKVKSSKREITIFVSNQTSYTSFLDTIMFFSIAYRRKQLSTLYFMPFDMEEWGIGSCLLYLAFLSPLTVTSTAGVDLLTSQSKQISFVWFPESTGSDDLALAKSTHTVDLMSSTDLLHVRTPRLSKLFTHLMSSSLLNAETDLSIIDSTLAYSGSLFAEAEERQAEGAANAYDGAIDDMEEEEFEQLASKQANGEGGALEDDLDGYSAETINNYSHGSITTRRKRAFEPTVPVFCTAAPLRPFFTSDSISPLPAASPSHAHTSVYSRPTPSPNAVSRVRIVPSFYDFLCGNAPTHAHVLLNEYDKEYLTSRVLKLEDCFPHLKKTATSKSKSPQLTAAEEEEEGSAPHPLSLALDTWLQQRFLHQEQQVTLFAVHSCYHTLPASLSASSIPISHPLESYTFPASSIRLAMFVAADWGIIIFSTLVFRATRSWLKGEVL